MKYNLSLLQPIYDALSQFRSWTLTTGATSLGDEMVMITYFTGPVDQYNQQQMETNLRNMTPELIDDLAYNIREAATKTDPKWLA